MIMNDFCIICWNFFINMLHNHDAEFFSEREKYLNYFLRTLVMSTLQPHCIPLFAFTTNQEFLSSIPTKIDQIWEIDVDGRQILKYWLLLVDFKTRNKNKRIILKKHHLWNSSQSSSCNVIFFYFFFWRYLPIMFFEDLVTCPILVTLNLIWIFLQRQRCLFCAPFLYMGV